MRSFGLKFTILLSSALLVQSAAFADPISQNYSEVQAWMHALVAQHPDTTQLFDLGLSDSGQTIQGLKIGNGPMHSLVVATHHGNEYGSTEVAKGFAKALAASPIQGQTMFVIPVLNIGGYNAHLRYEQDSKGQYDDPNRDYPGPCGTEGPFHLKSTAALAQFLDAQNIVASATLHTYSPAVVYPWGISTHDLSTPYDDLFMKLVEAATQESGYAHGNNTELIYPADGAFEDYAFWKSGVWSILFELGYTHSPTQAEVDQMIEVNVPGMRRMFEISPTKRAEQHAFTGQCDNRLKALDLHDE